jgi:hypothetical protein
MPTIWALVSAAGACVATVLETAILRVSSAKGKACRPACFSAALMAEEERAKSMSGLLEEP